MSISETLQASMSQGGDTRPSRALKSTPPVPIFTETTDDPSSDETPTTSHRPGSEEVQATEHVFAKALVELRNEVRGNYETLATDLSGVQRGLHALKQDFASHARTSQLQHAASLKAMQSLGDGLVELNQVIQAKDKIDAQRNGAWKAELDAVAEQAGKSVVELVNEDGAAREQLVSLHETVDKQKIEVQKAAKLANTAIQAAAIRIGVVVAVILTTYKIAAYCWTHGWLTP